MKVKALLNMVLFFSLPLPVHAGWFGNYDDCILENMKGVQSNTAVFAVKQACRSKYPAQPGEECEKQSKNSSDPYAFLDCYSPKGIPYDEFEAKCLKAHCK